MSGHSGGEKPSLLWTIPILLTLLATAGFFLPLTQCDWCHDLRKSIKTTRLDAVQCPCCGNSLRLSLFHRLLGGHQGHLDDLHRALSS